jgi:thiosulfate dehydrogenase [quinone] large subunit
MRITRTGTLVMTAIAAALYIFLEWAFGRAGVFSLDGPWFSFTSGEDKAIADGVFWTWLMLALIVAGGLWQWSRTPEDGIQISAGMSDAGEGQIHDPKWWRLLVGNVYLSLLWLPIRFFVGREWLAAGEHKVRSDAWMDGGAALVSGNPEAPGFWESRVAVPPDVPRAAIHENYAWYREFLQYLIDNEWASFFGKLIAVGEVMVGLGLLFGALVGIAAFFGTVMNMSFMLAGTASTNPVMFGLTVFVILGWKVAGWFGLDRWILPALGTPWQAGRIFGGTSRLEPQTTSWTPPQKYA